MRTGAPRPSGNADKVGEGPQGKAPDAYWSGDSSEPSASSWIIVVSAPGAGRGSELTSRFFSSVPPPELHLQPASVKQTRQAVRAATKVRIIVPVP